MRRYAFAPFTEADLPLMAAWLSRPHVAKWWGDPAEALDEIRGHLRGDTVKPYLMLLDGKPVGYIQSYDIDAEDEHPYSSHIEGTIGIDLSIGEADLIGRGHGPRFIETFAAMLFAEGVPRVLIDPDPSNASAIRAYAKAGFTPVGEMTSIYGPALIMVRDAETKARI